MKCVKSQKLLLPFPFEVNADFLQKNVKNALSGYILFLRIINASFVDPDEN